MLVVDQSDNYEYFCHKYKTPNITKKRFKNISQNFENLKNKKFFSEENLKRLIYFTNKDDVVDLLLFSICVNDKTSVSKINELLNYVNICKIPKFPISGDYLKKYGYESGKELGKKLKLELNNIIEDSSMSGDLIFEGNNWWPRLNIKSIEIDQSLFQTLLRQELIANGLFMGASLNLCLAHSENKIFNDTLKRFQKSILSMKKIKSYKNPEYFLRGKKINAVFKVI